MASQNSNIDQIHAGAICDEIGERLRVALTGIPDRMPQNILGLTERFDREGGNDAPTGREAG